MLSATVTGCDLTLRISDNGIGLTSEDLSSIFTMFSQVKSAQERAEGGLGIGLALSKGLVELHGGRIEAHSAGPGHGSTFTIQLAGAVQAEAEAEHSPARSRPLLSRRVLVADDNQDAAQSLAMLLKVDGHDVSVVHDGAAALSEFDRTKPDVVLLDLGMPKRSGFDVAREIRANKENNNVLLIAITGWGQMADRAKAARAGFDHHLTKPVDYAELALLFSPDSRRARIDAL